MMTIDKVALISIVVALGLLTTPANAKSIWQELNEAAPRSIFEDLQRSAPRSVFDEMTDTAPVCADDAEAGALHGE
ncbi:MAG: hypothetical protein SFW09_13745 [Hyphomicrobiaceae bacterium]|nr:hypothetical protein [Hyphomicrobiaceae bacterium]